MSKRFLPSIFFITALFVPSVHADVSSLAQKYTWGEYSFDGITAKNDRGAAVNINNKLKTVDGNLQIPLTDGSKGVAAYNMNWTSETTADKTDILTITESRLTPTAKDKTEVYARTTTIAGDYLRSSTMCYGDSTVGKLRVRTNDLKCLTATKNSCKRLMEEYNKATGMNALSMTDAVKASQYCASVLRGYENMAKAFGRQSPQVASRQEEVIDSDNSRVKSMVDQVTNSKGWEPTNIAAKTESKELDKMAAGYATSINGMKVLMMAIQTCQDSLSDFKPDTASSSSGTSSATGNKTAQ